MSQRHQRGKPFNWELRAEDHEGAVHVLRRFQTKREAEDHPVIAKHWRRFWAQKISPPAEKVVTFALPWSVEDAATFTYLRDADGARLLSLFGPAEQRTRFIEIMREKGLVA